MIKRLLILSILVLSPRIAWSEELAVSVTKTRLEYLAELTREFKSICGRFPQSVESFFEPDSDSCPQFPRLTTAYSLLDGWERTFNLIARGRGAYIVSYGADGKEGGLGANRDIAVPVEDAP
jgi:hypothetical protein